MSKTSCEVENFNRDAPSLQKAHTKPLDKPVALLAGGDFFHKFATSQQVEYHILPTIFDLCRLLELDYLQTSLTQTPYDRRLLLYC